MNIVSITNSAAKDSQTINGRQPMQNKRQDGILNSIQDQIMGVQNQLKKISENEEMSLEEKMSKRKELQQQLQDLNKQYTQRKMEVQKEKREKRAAEANANTENKERKEPGVMDSSSMHGLINASSSMESVKTVQSVHTKLEGEARIAEAEFKRDMARGASTGGQANRLSDLKSRAESAAGNVMRQLGNVNEAVEETKDTEKTDKDSNEKETQNGTLVSDSDNPKDGAQAINGENSVSSEYRPVNVLL